MMEKLIGDDVKVITAGGDKQSFVWVVHESYLSICHGEIN